MKIIGIIPARWASTRFEGKVLADIHGRPMIQHVWERARKSRLLAEVFIACDDDRVLTAARGFGASAIMTSPRHASGTDRIAEAAADIPADIVVNIQGDEPLIRHEVIDALAQALRDDETCPMATVVRVIDDEQEAVDPNVVKVVMDGEGYALYFSRARIPFNRDNREFGRLTYYKHIGLYAYRKDFLMGYQSLPPSPLEETEKLEQLRALAAGYKIKTVISSYDSVAVDTPGDLDRVRDLMREGQCHG